MPLIKKATSQLKESDKRLLFALYDEQKATDNLKSEVEALSEQVQSLQEAIVGLTESIDDLRKEIKEAASD